MKCSADLELQFEGSEIRIRPYDADIQSNYGKHDHVRCKLSQKAADLVSAVYVAGEPVTLYIGGEKAFRALVPADEPLEYDSDIHDYAYLTLIGQQSILQNGTIDETVEGQVSDAVDAIVDGIVDPNGVITDVRYGSSLEEFRYLDDGVFLSGDTGSWFQKAENLLEKTSFWIGDRANLYSIDPEGIFYFNHVTPQEALSELEEKYQFRSRIDRSGVLWVAPPNLQQDTYWVGPQRGLISMSSYAVPEQKSPLTTVVVQGGKILGVMKEDSARDTRTFRAFARATRTDVATERFDFETVDAWKQQLNPLKGNIVLERREKDGDALQSIALNALSAKVTNRTQGTVTVNGYTGNDDAGNLHDLSVGQNFVVSPYVECKDRDIRGGVFTVTGFQHQLSPMDGWSVSVDVAHNFLSAENVETEYFLIDTYSGERMDPDEIYLD